MSAQNPSKLALSDIQQLVKVLGGVSAYAWRKSIPSLRLHSIDRYENLVEPGDIEDRLFLVLQGVLGLYLAKDNKEYYVDFRIRGQFASAIISFIKEIPSELGLKALKPSKVVSIPRSIVYDLYDKDISVNKLGRKYIENELVKEIRRSNQMYIYSAEERYLNLLKNEPDFASQVPLKYLASYLGMEAESLSRIRGRMQSKMRIS